MWPASPSGLQLAVPAVADNSVPGRGRYLLFSGVVLTCCAVFEYAYRVQLLTALMLFLPLIDTEWSLPGTLEYKHRPLIRLLLLLAIVLIFMVDVKFTEMVVSVILFTALPEEWFFRAYFMTQLEKMVRRRYEYSRRRVDRKPTSAELNERFDNIKTISNTVLRPDHAANLGASVFFSALHLPTQGLMGLSVFLPSLVFGWLYQKTRDLVLVILLHGVSNLFFYIVIKRTLVMH